MAGTPKPARGNDGASVANALQSSVGGRSAGMRASPVPSTPGASPRSSYAPLRTPPRSPATVPRSTSSSSDVFFSPATMATSSRLSTSSRPQAAAAGYASDSNLAAVLQTVKIIQARIEDTERAFHRQSLEREDLEQQLRLERNERQKLQQIVSAEQEERRMLTDTVAKLQATVEETVVSTAAAHRQMSVVPPQVERLQNELRLCARVDDTQGWLGEQERRLQQRLTQTAATLDEYHQDFTDTSASLASALKSKQFKLQALSDAQAKLETTVHDLGTELAGHRTETADALRGVADSNGTMRQQLDERCDRLNGRADGLVGTLTDLNAALRDQLHADVDAVKSSLAESVSRQSARVQAVEDALGEQLSGLAQSLEEKMAGLQKSVGEGLEKTEQRREDSIARERAAWSSECDVLRTALSSSTKALSEELVASVDKLNAQCGTLEADVSSGTATLKDSLATLSSTIAAEQEERRKQLGEMQATAAASAAELERSTSARLDESAAGVQSACAKMNADIAQTAEDVLAIRTVMDAKIERECEALETSLQRATQGFGDRLGSFQDEINGQVVVRLDDFDSKLGGMQKRLAPCEDKLLEVALKAEVKAQTMLMEMRVAEIENAVPELADSLEKIEDGWQEKLDGFEEELSEFSTDLTMLETAVTVTSAF